MQREAYETFKYMVRENLPITTLVDADFVLVNDILSRHYNLPEQSGSQLRRISVPDDSPYGGLLTTGAVMKVTADGTASSPIVRGAWVMDRLLGDPPTTTSGQYSSSGPRYTWSNNPQGTTCRTCLRSNVCCLSCNV